MSGQVYRDVRGTIGTFGGTTAMVLLLLSAGLPLRVSAQTSATIYNDGRVLVRRVVPMTISSGTSVQRVDLGPLDPSTLFALDPEVMITGARYDGALDQRSALRRAVGQQLLFVRRETEDTMSGVVLGVDPLRIQMADGRVAFAMPGFPLFPGEVAAAERSVILGLRSAAQRRGLRLGYFTNGASWMASYQVVLGRTDARVTGAAAVTSETLQLQDTELQLLAGAVSQVEPPPQPPRPLMARTAEAKAFSDVATNTAAEQRVGEFHLYTLPGRTSLQPGQTATVALFEPARVKFEKSYVVRGQLPYWGYLPPQGEPIDVPVEVFYTLQRPRGADFGDRPLPGGVARLFEPDSAGRLQLVGEARTEHTPAGKELRLAAGNAFDLTATRVQTGYTTRRDSTPGGATRTIATVDYRVTVTNATDSAVTVEVREERAGEWTVVSSSVPAEKVSSTVTRFRLKVPARDEATMTYRLRVVW